MSIEIQPILDAARKSVDACKLEKPGQFKRYPNAPAGTPQAQNDIYGITGAVNMLYTLNEFNLSPADRMTWIHELQSLQDKQTGLYGDKAHHPIHTTAHTIATLELFDTQVIHPPHALLTYADPDHLPGFLESLPWEEDPWQSSHLGSGLYTILVLARQVDLTWEDAYFEWLDKEIDPATGLLRQGLVKQRELNGEQTLLPFLAGHFHYLFTYAYAKRAHPFSFRLIDSAIDVMECNWNLFAKRLGFFEIFWVYCLTRSRLVSTHRREEVDQALKHFAVRYVDLLNEFTQFNGFNDIHMMFGAVTVLAELQTALPGLLRSRRPLRSVLERRPFL